MHSNTLVLHQGHIQLDFLGDVCQLDLTVWLNDTEQVLLQHGVIQRFQMAGHNGIRFQFYVWDVIGESGSTMLCRILVGLGSAWGCGQGSATTGPIPLSMALDGLNESKAF